MRAGERVEVRTRYEGSWSRGFTIAEVVGGDRDQYRLRRDSDGAVLGVEFDGSELRPVGAPVASGWPIRS